MLSLEMVSALAFVVSECGKEDETPNELVNCMYLVFAFDFA